MGDGAKESNVAKHATTLLMSQENTCLNQVGVYNNPSSDQIDHKNHENNSQINNSIPLKRTRRQPSKKVSKDFLR